MADNISTQWTGHDLLDVKGEKIGTVEDVRFGDATGGLTWLLVKTGFLGAKKVLVPAGDVRATKDALVVPYDKDRIKEAPSVEQDETFSLDEERRICAYYGLDYVSEMDMPVEGCAGDATARSEAVSPEAPARMG